MKRGDFCVRSSNSGITATLRKVGKGILWQGRTEMTCWMDFMSAQYYVNIGLVKAHMLKSQYETELKVVLTFH